MAAIRGYSASQLSEFSACKRSWYFSTVLHIRKPQSEGQRYGDIIHKQIEDYFKAGKAIEDPRAQHALKKLPLPSEFIQIEGNVSISIDAGREMRGRKDLVDASDPSHPIIIDHKTSKDPKKYAKTEYELVNDLQMNIYAMDLFTAFPEAQVCTVAHNTIASQGAMWSKLTPVTLTRSHVEKNWSKYLKIVDEMDQIRELPRAGVVPANGKQTGQCEKYGGCQHLANCKSAFLGGFKKEEEKEQRKPMPISEALQAKLAKLNGGKSVKNEELTSAKPVVKEPVKVISKAPPPEDQEDAQEALEEKIAQEPKRGRGRPAIRVVKKAPEAKAPVAEAAPEPDVTEVAEEIVPSERLKEASAEVQDIPPEDYPPMVLYINAIPSTHHERLEKWIAPMLAQIEQETGKDYQSMSYREGCSLLCKGIRENAEQLPAMLVVDSTTYLGKTALEALVPLYPMTVEALNR